jgi:hypothetical protein
VYEDKIIKPTKYCLKRGKEEGLREHNREGESDLYISMEIS